MSAFGQSQTKIYKDRILRQAANKVTNLKKMGQNPSTYFGDTASKVSGGITGALKQAEVRVRKQAAEEGRPMYPGDVRTKAQLNKYVKVGLREKNLDQATERSASFAVMQGVINRLGGIGGNDPVKAESVFSQTRNQIRTMGKVTGGAAAYVVGRVFTPTKTASPKDSMINPSGLDYKKSKKQK